MRTLHMRCMVHRACLTISPTILASDNPACYPVFSRPAVSLLLATMAESTQASPARKARDTNWTREEIHALVDAYDAVCGDNRGYGQKTNLNWTEIVKRMA